MCVLIFYIKVTEHKMCFGFLYKSDRTQNVCFGFYIKVTEHKMCVLIFYIKVTEHKMFVVGF